MFEFRPAIRQQTKLLIALAGPSGCGKTFSALRLAAGLVGPKGRVAAIDTEAGRALHYASRFKFDHGDLSPPFRPERYLEAIEAAEGAGYDAIVTDSMSHEWEGTGGLQEWAADEEARGTKSPGNWKIPKTAHKRFMNRLLQCRSHLIFCLRAEEKIKIERVYDERKGREVTAVVPIGWQPICEKRFMYEMTCSFLLLPDAPGIPQPIKLQDQHRAAFPDGQHISEASGQALAEWANGGEAPAAPAPKASAGDFWGRESLAIPLKGDPGQWRSRLLKAIEAAPNPGKLNRLIQDNKAALDAQGDDGAFVLSAAMARSEQLQPRTAQ